MARRIQEGKGGKEVTGVNIFEKRRQELEIENQIRKEVDTQLTYINPFKAREYIKFLLERIDEIRDLNSQRSMK